MLKVHPEAIADAPADAPAGAPAGLPPRPVAQATPTEPEAPLKATEPSEPDVYVTERLPEGPVLLRMLPVPAVAGEAWEGASLPINSDGRRYLRLTCSNANEPARRTIDCIAAATSTLGCVA